MKRLVLLLALPLLLVSSAEARTRPSSRATAAELPVSIAVVSGTVSSVSGNTVFVAEGTVAIDAAGARIVSETGESSSVGSIKPGDEVHVVLRTTSVAPNEALPASIIAVTRDADVTLGGTVQSVDLASQSFQLLGRTVRVNAQTSFGGRSSSGLASLQSGEHVVVRANAEGGQLVAVSVLQIGAFDSGARLIAGTVKSIGADSWVITDRDGKDQTVLVNANTRVAGTPKVGDPVIALVTTNTANQLVALAIASAQPVLPPQTNLPRAFDGVVRSTGAVWVIRTDEGEDVSITITARTVFLGVPAVGDRVGVLALPQDGKLTAILIAKR